MLFITNYKVKLITNYKVKPYLTKAETRELMGVFAKQGSGPGVTAHYVAADGSHGVVVSDVDDVGPTYRVLPEYTQWIEYDTKVMLTIDHALG